MMTLKKASKMAGLAFTNALRLHRDSIALYNNGSFPSSYQLSILAQEEIGKAFLLEEIVSQDCGQKIDDDKEFNDIMIKTLLSHKSKQGWFSRQADDIFKYHAKRFPKFVKEVSSGKLEEKKQNATYTGLSKKNGKIDIEGKIIQPTLIIKEDDAKAHITRVNDFIITLIEGCRRGLLFITSSGLDEQLVIETSSTLEKLWTIKSNETIKKLGAYRKYEVEIED